MNREIKFRAFDNENKYMVTSKQGVFTALRNSMNIVRQNDGYYNDGDLLKPNKEKYTLMQYTGLHDKNGKEIYEGDIIRIKNSLIEIEGEVIFDTIDLAFEVYDKENDCKEMLLYTNKEFEVLR